MLTTQIDLNFGDGGFFNPLNPHEMNTRDEFVELVADGDALLIGSTEVNGRGNGLAHISRVLRNGGIDTSFGDNGRLSFPMELGNETLVDLVRHTEDRVLAAFQSGPRSMFVALNSGGEVDESFGAAGRVTFDEPRFAIENLVVDANSSIFAHGIYNGTHYRIYKLGPNGKVNSSFGTNGFVDIAKTAFPRILPKPVPSGDGGLLLPSIERTEKPSYALNIRKLNANGELDSTYSGDGVFAFEVSEDVSQSYFGEVLLKQGSSEDWFVAGMSRRDVTDQDFYVLRLSPSGELRGDFGNSGITIIETEEGWGTHVRDFEFASDGTLRLFATLGNPSTPAHIAIASSGEILHSKQLSTGTTYYNLAASSVLWEDQLIGVYTEYDEADIRLLHFSEAGDLGDGFGGSGYVDLNLGDHFQSDYGGQLIALQDGKLLSVASRFRPDVETYSFPVVLTRYNQDGSIDETYGNQGHSELPSRFEWNFRSRFLQNANEKFLVRFDPNTILISRLTQDGEIDEAFGDAGSIYLDHQEISFLHSLIVTQDGFALAGIGNYPDNSYLLLRFDRDGVPINSFGDAGTLRIPFTQRGSNRISVYSDREGRLLTIANKIDTFSIHPIVSRYLDTGELDSSFGDSGSLPLEQFPFHTIVSPDGDGRILIASQGLFGSSGLRVHRYTDAGDIDTSFGSNGLGEIPYPTSWQGADPKQLLVDSRGRITVVLDTTIDGVSESYLARFTPDGSPDLGFGFGGILRVSSSIYEESIEQVSLDGDSDGLLIGGTRLTDQFQESFFARTIEAEPAFPWHNPLNPSDSNNDLQTSPIDALLALNFLNEYSATEIHSEDPPEFGWIDANADNWVTPLDALLIINQLNEQSSGEGEAGATTLSALLSAHLETLREKEKRFL